MGGIYGVGRAAMVPPALAVLSHTPPGAHETIAWVGKGIVYDTGGLSIKSKVIIQCSIIYLSKQFFLIDSYAWYEKGLRGRCWNFGSVLRSCEGEFYSKSSRSVLFG